MTTNDLVRYRHPIISHFLKNDSRIFVGDFRVTVFGNRSRQYRKKSIICEIETFGGKAIFYSMMTFKKKLHMGFLQTKKLPAAGLQGV